jgi:hypothetical protein
MGDPRNALAFFFFFIFAFYFFKPRISDLFSGWGNFFNFCTNIQAATCVIRM